MEENVIKKNILEWFEPFFKLNQFFLMFNLGIDQILYSYFLKFPASDGYNRGHGAMGRSWSHRRAIRGHGWPRLVWSVWYCVKWFLFIKNNILFNLHKNGVSIEKSKKMVKKTRKSRLFSRWVKNYHIFGFSMINYNFWQNLT